jgi:undecaprenyl-diphosphatase
MSWVGELDLRILRRVAGHRSAALDRTMPALSRAANHGVLWEAVAAALAATGNRQARRAALRGLVALGVASVSANVLSKRLVRRVRPAAELVPLIRRPHPIPITTSFPSGHSASAAAFATAVALEAPALAVPVAALAGGVAVSRVVTGAHFPTDVLAGVALGAGVATATQIWWPRRPPGPAAAGEPDRPAPASPTGSGAVIVVNPGAGTADGVLDTLRAELPDADIVRLSEEDDPEEVLRAAAGRAKVLGIAGGDGTINTAARHAAARDVPLLVVPAGTLNHFAGELGVATVSDAVAALRAGSAVRVDLGRAGDEIFLNTFSVGLYPDLVRFRERWEPRVGKWPAMLIGLHHTLRRGRPQELLVDGEPRTLWMVFAGNGEYRPQGFAPTFRPRLDDGRLDLRIFDATVRFAVTRLVLGALTRTLRYSPAYRFDLVRGLTLRAPDGDTLDLCVDGELRQGPGEIELRVDPAALLVYRPDSGN